MHQEKLADVGLPPTLFLQRKHNDSLKKSKRMDNEWAWFQWVPGCFCLLLPTQPTGITIPGMEQLIKSAMLFLHGIAGLIKHIMCFLAEAIYILRINS
jgi:hypothetical protein